MVAWLERHQVPVYLGAILAGVLFGLLVPVAGPGLETAINPVLGVLLYATFLQVPARELLRSLRAGRFLGAALVVNFVAVPLVVAVMFGWLPTDPAVRIGVLLVLLTPCVDYVIVFSGLVGGSARLLAATPVLLVAQMLLLPVFLWLFLGSDLVGIVEFGPFLRAFLTLIAIPLALAWATQRWTTVTRVAGAGVVPLMIATLLTVVASQVPKLGDFGTVLGVIPFYVAFLLVMPALGLATARLFRLDTADSRAITFTGATRNSLVVLPLALALPDTLGVTAIVVVTQTLVEVLGMVVYVRLVPAVIRALWTQPNGAGG
ncbi:arsenic resistance protein [Actinokineospora enzanensis]|uniref:arsenic resistance protein n=1 Tax=Actinokineospora enzanensis TaxID=155975 RepID=UPI000371E85F|nr:arsenic resistance protein [Actinokineospora enzanensis]